MFCNYISIQVPFKTVAVSLSVKNCNIKGLYLPHHNCCDTRRCVVKIIRKMTLIRQTRGTKRPFKFCLTMDVIFEIEYLPPFKLNVTFYILWYNFLKFYAAKWLYTPRCRKGTSLLLEKSCKIKASAHMYGVLLITLMKGNPICLVKYHTMIPIQILQIRTFLFSSNIKVLFSGYIIFFLMHNCDLKP